MTIYGIAAKLAGECEPIASYNIPIDEEGRPLTSECAKHDFIKMYNSPEVASAFAGLYANEDGLQDKLMAYWAVVSDYFKNNEYVIGYDVLNEPWPANIYHDINLILHPDTFDREKLFPLEQRAHETIRQHDDAKIIFFEPAQYPDTLPFLGGMTFPTGFPETPGGKDYINRQSLNDHTYCCQASGTMCANGEPPLEK